jgi:UDP-hydrolysing UDP-N-acetyl-D-glucosamine 2-epimerase
MAGNEMRKICVVVLSRANYGRVKSVMQAVENHPDLELNVVAGASALVRRFGTVSDVIKRDGFNIDALVYSLIEGETPETMAKSTALTMLELPTILKILRPDIVVTVADRFETLATAVAATYMNLPLAHVQGGEVSGSIDESVRHAITKLAHIHFPATKLAAERIIKMGERPETVFQVGDPAIDIVANTSTELDKDNIFSKYGGVGPKINLSEPYLLVVQHSVTTEYSDALRQINETLGAVRELKIPTIMLWPNPDAGSDGISKGIRVFREKYNPDFMHFFINLPVEEYIRLLCNCACAVGNSSSFIREGSFLGVPAVNIGTRQKGRERGKNVIDVDYNKDEIKQAILKQIEHGKYEPEYIYGDGKAGKRIANILATCEVNIQKQLAY